MQRTPEARKQRQTAFLNALMKCGRMGRAAQAAGVSLRAIQKWRKSDSSFAEAITEAEAVAVLIAEDELFRRAVEGVKKPVFYRGQQCGEIVEYSDQLLIKLLQSLCPERYSNSYRLRLEQSPTAGLTDEQLLDEVHALVHRLGYIAVDALELARLRAVEAAAQAAGMDTANPPTAFRSAVVQSLFDAPRPVAR
jgi:hypothetical protein